MASLQPSGHHIIVPHTSTIAGTDHLIIRIFCRIFQRLNVQFLITLLLISFSSGQSLTIIGRVIDGSTRNGIANAAVSLQRSERIEQSDGQGFFRLSIRSAEELSLIVRHPAYCETMDEISSAVNSNDTVTVILQPRVFQADEILIRSTRLPAAEGNTPFPANVLLHDDLLRHSDTTPSDILNHTPGISLIQDGTWETSIAIRGMNRSSIIALVDNIRIETASDISGALSLVNVHDLERIETIRSSGASVYGTGALGGIIHFITKRASFTEASDTQAEVNSEYATVNNCTSQYISLERSSERISGRISGGVRHADNTMTPSGALANSQFKDFNVTGSLGFKTIEEQSLHLSYQLSQAENTGISGGSPISTAATATYKRMRRELFGLEYLFPSISPTVSSLTARLSYQNISRNVEIIQTPSLTLTPHAVHSTVNAQIESRINTGGISVLAVGAEVWQRELTSKREKINTANMTVTGDIPIPHSRFLSAGIYAQDEWAVIPEMLSFVSGVRYDWIRVSNDQAVNPEYVITNGTLNTTPSNQTVLWKNGSATNGSWSINSGVQYSLSENVQLTTLFSTAFRSPSLEERYQYLTLGDGIHVGNPDLKPEQSTGLNAGIQLHMDGLKFRTDLFINSLSDLVSEVPGTFEGSAAYVKQNISKARLYGYEISGEQLLVQGTSLLISVSSVRGENTASHTNLPFIPPVRGSIEVRTYYNGKGTLALASTLSAAQSNTAAGETQTPGYAVVDINAASDAVIFGQFSFIVRCGIQNIFNKAYHNHLSTVRGPNRDAPGRNFTLSITVTV
ncbi:MAG: TonB-dependent receptor [Bacteroidota bacterium]